MGVLNLAPFAVERLKLENKELLYSILDVKVVIVTSGYVRNFFV